MARLPIPGSDDGTWGDILNTYLEVSHNSDGTLITSALASAGAEMTSNRGVASGYAGLDSSSKLPVSNLPTITESMVSNLTADLAATEKTANKDQPNGYAGLDGSGLLKTSELPPSVVTDSQLPMVLAPAPSGGDDTAAIQAVIDSLPSNGGTISFRSGVYSFLGSLNFDNTNGITIQGTGGIGGGGGIGGTPVNSTVFVYNASGARFISARGSYGFRIRYLQIYYTNSAFTGNVVDLDESLQQITNQMLLDNVALEAGGLSPRTATLLSLNNAVDGSFNNCKFAGANIGVKGKIDNAHFSNAHMFSNCIFVYNATIHTKNAGQAWTFQNCTFENLADLSAGAYTHDATITGQGLTFIGCWFGDDTSSGGTQITWSGESLTIIGGFMAFNGNPSTAIKLNEDNCIGVSILGVIFSCTPAASGTAFDFGSTTGHKRLILLGNTFESGVTEFAGTIPDGLICQTDKGVNFKETQLVRYAINSLAVQAAGYMNLALQSSGNNNPSMVFTVVNDGVNPANTTAQIQVGDDLLYHPLVLQPNGGAVLVGNANYGIGFNGATQIGKPTVTGSKGGNTALASLITALSNYGLITDSTS